MMLGIEQIQNDKGILLSQSNNSIGSYHDIIEDSDTAASIREIMNIPIITNFPLLFLDNWFFVITDVSIAF